MTTYENITDEFEASLTDLATFLITDLRKELSDQGHMLTGKLAESIEMTDIKLRNGDPEAFVSMEYYYYWVDRGVRRERINYHPGSGRDKSLYIEALIRFWMIKKGLSLKEAKQAAFFTARKHKKEGMPTQSSWEHSKNGKRMSFLEDTLDDSNHYDLFETDVQDSLERLSNTILDHFENTLK